MNIHEAMVDEQELATIRLEASQFWRTRIVEQWRRLAINSGGKEASKIPQGNRQGLYYLPFSVVTKKYNKVVGVIILAKISFYHETAYARTIIAKKSRRRGYAKEAKMLALAFSFFDLLLWKVCSEAVSANAATIQANKDCGFKQEGSQKDQVRVGQERFSLVLMAAFKKYWPQILLHYNQTQKDRGKPEFWFEFERP